MFNFRFMIIQMKKLTFLDTLFFISPDKRSIHIKAGEEDLHKEAMGNKPEDSRDQNMPSAEPLGVKGFNADK